jgi:adenosylhomocysteinase
LKYKEIGMAGRAEIEQLLVAVARASNRSLAASSWDPAIFYGGGHGEYEGECGGGGNGEDVFDGLVSSVSYQTRAMLSAWGIRLAEDGEAPDFSLSDVADILQDPPAKKSARERIEYARSYMPCVAALREEYMPGGGGEFAGFFDGVRIAAGFIIEPKTAVAILTLKELGASVSLYGNASSADQTIVDALKAAGVRVYADAGNTSEQDLACALEAVDELDPEILMDDGAGLSRLLYKERKVLADRLTGICEETTSGVTALEAMALDGTLTVPAIAVNDAAVKTFFDNLHGTGETVLAALVALTGSACGKRVLVCGYGRVGEGLARRLRGTGAFVTISETDPVSALRALHDGYDVMPAEDAAAYSDIIISASGVRHTIGLNVLAAAPDNAIIATAGGTPGEIALDDAIQTPGAKWDDKDKDRCILTLEGKELTVLSQGHGINYTSGDGNAVETMDLSFAAQISALAYLLKNKGKLSAGVHRMPKDIAEHIAAVKLTALHKKINPANEPYDWRLTSRL